MTKLEAALVEVASLLDELAIPYMLIGGLAVSIGVKSGPPSMRISVFGSSRRIWKESCTRLVRGFNPFLPIHCPVPPVKASSGVRADLVFAFLPVEQESIARAVAKSIQGQRVMIATVEDLIWMKLLSERRKDNEDARLLLRRFADVLDRGYLEPLLLQISDSFARADILELYRREIP